MTFRHLVVSYDVVDDRKRFRLARFLRGYLDRVQKSVFEGMIPDRLLETLRRGIGETVDREEDSVRIYKLCERCKASVEIIGTGVYIDREDKDVVV